MMTFAPKKGSLLTAYSHDPASRAEWEREEQRARKLALAKLDEIEKLYREMAEVDGLGLDPKRDADTFDFKRMDVEQLEPIIGRHLILQNILLVREVLMDGRRPWRDDFTNLRDRHERLMFALGPDLMRGLGGMANSRSGGAARREEAKKREPELQAIVNQIHRENPTLRRLRINKRAAKVWNERHLDRISYKLVENHTTDPTKRKK